MLTTILLATLLLVLTVTIHYEGLRFLSVIVEGRWVPPRARIVLVILGVMLVHLVEIALYGIAYWLAVEYWHLGEFSGTQRQSLANYLYFSAETFTTLGLGDIYPIGDLRMIASVEALNGVLLLAWSGSFTYLVMQRFWSQHTIR